MANRRSTRYQITVTRQDGTSEVIQASSRKADAIKRAKFVAMDSAGWASVVSCAVVDTMPQMVEGRFVDVVAAYGRPL